MATKTTKAKPTKRATSARSSSAKATRTKTPSRTPRKTQASRGMATVPKKQESGFKTFLKAVGLIACPLIVGGIAALLTSNAMTTFDQFNQPPLSPPAWLFPVAWTILYILMGVASFLIVRKPIRTLEEKKHRNNLLLLYFAQLVFNFLWSIIFFTFGQYWFALVWLMIMWIMIIILIIRSFNFSRAAAILLLPYFLWTTFAAYLNFMIAMLN